MKNKERVILAFTIVVLFCTAFYLGLQKTVLEGRVKRGHAILLPYDTETVYKCDRWQFTNEGDKNGNKSIFRRSRK